MAGHPAGVDGYITIPSMARLAVTPPGTRAAVMGAGRRWSYFALSGRRSCIGFEMFTDRTLRAP